MHQPRVLAQQYGLAEPGWTGDPAQAASGIEQRTNQPGPVDMQRWQPRNGCELLYGTCLCTERIRNEAYGHGKGSLVRISPLKHSAVCARHRARSLPRVAETPALSLHTSHINRKSTRLNSSH